MRRGLLACLVILTLTSGPGAWAGRKSSNGSAGNGGTAPQLSAAACAELFFNARRIVLGPQGLPVFTQEQKQYFAEQRENIRRVYTDLRNTYYEQEHFIRRVFLALMGQSHVFAAGDSGGGKSAVVSTVTRLPKQYPDGSYKEDLFEITINQMTSDANIRGYVDNAVLANGHVRLQDVSNHGTVVHYPKALFDEIHNGSPLAYSSILDILNEKVARYGPVTAAVRTRSVIANSNLSVYEFHRLAESKDMGPTSEAAIDRIVYSVMVHNYVTDVVLRARAIGMGFQGSRSRAVEELANPEADYEEGLQAQVRKQLYPNRDFNFPWLGRLALATSSANPDVQKVAEEIIDLLRKGVFDLRRRSENEFYNYSGDGAPKAKYYPSSQFSMRQIMELTLQSTAISTFLDLLILPEEVLSTDMLVRIVEGGMPLDILSLYRMHEPFFTAAVGDPRLVIPQGGSGAEMVYGDELKVLQANPRDARQATMYEYVQEERAIMAAAFKARIAASHRNTVNHSAVLLDFMKSLNVQSSRTGSPPSIEELLIVLKQQAGY